MAADRSGRRRALLLYLGMLFIAVGIALLVLSAVLNWSRVPVLAGPLVVNGIGYVVSWRLFPYAQRRRTEVAAMKADNLAKLQALEAEDRRRIAPLLKAQGYSAPEAGRGPRAAS